MSLSKKSKQQLSDREVGLLTIEQARAKGGDLEVLVRFGLSKEEVDEYIIWHTGAQLVRNLDHRGARLVLGVPLKSLDLE